MYQRYTYGNIKITSSFQCRVNFSLQTVPFIIDHRSSVQRAFMESYGGAEVQSRNSFTALLELSPNQATELLHTAGAGDGFSPPEFAANVQNRQWIVHQTPYNHTLNCPLPFPSNTALVERAAKYSVFATTGAATSCYGGGGTYGNEVEMKRETADSSLNPNFNSQVSDPTVMCQIKTSAKRKEKENKGKGSIKNSKAVVNGDSGDGEKLPYIHVRVRRGQATDSHSLAERARREKINARMKILQELVPGCNKISSTALVLDQIIKHVQNLQCQVEYLSMKVAAVNSRTDFNLDTLVAAKNVSLMGDNFQSMMMPLTWPEIHMSGSRELVQEPWINESLVQPDWVGEEDEHDLLTPENSLLSYGSGNSASMHPCQQ